MVDVDNVSAEKTKDLLDLCTRLSSNDPEVKEVVVHADRFPKGYCVALGDALRGNSNVSTLTLHMDILLSAEQRRTVKSLAPLVHFIQSGSALQSLTLASFRLRVALPLIRRILTAAASNDALEELNLLHIDVFNHVDAFCHLMQKTKSLRRLLIHKSNHSPMESQERVAAALGSNRTLECLVFNCTFTRFPESLLLALLTHPQLKKLCLNAPVKHMDSVANLGTLLQSKVSQLRDLELSWVAFDDRYMDGFVLGLRDSLTLEKLSFCRCALDDEATEQFLQFFGKNAFSVRELTFDCVEFGSRTACDVAIDLLRYNQCLEKVAYGYRRYYRSTNSDDFLIQFASIAATVRLQHLELIDHFRETHWPVLGGRVLPSARLQELTLREFPDQPGTTTGFLEGLRCNGSLYQVHVSGIGSSLATADTRRMEAYLARNRYVAQCWAPSNAETNDEIHRLIFPRVTLAVQPIENLSPNMILTGLLAMRDDGIGPQHNTLSGTVRLL